MQRRKSKEISIGNIKIGADNPISVQSMCNTDTRDIAKTSKQIKQLAEAGCEIVRLAVLNPDAADAIRELVKISPVPLVADIHFDYRLANEDKDGKSPYGEWLSAYVVVTYDGTTLHYYWTGIDSAGWRIDLKRRVEKLSRKDIYNSKAV